MLNKRFRFFLPVLALILAPVTDGFAGTTVSSGTTVNSSAVTWPVTVQSGGTLKISTASTNIGTTTQTLTISGTGNGTVSETDTTPLGAIYSVVTCSQNQGIYATVNVSDSASVTCNAQRLRFQGNVTGGTLTTYALTTNGEVHAGYNSSFNIGKLIIGAGNFTFCATDGTNRKALSHISRTESKSKTVVICVFGRARREFPFTQTRQRPLSRPSPLTRVERSKSKTPTRVLMLI